MSSTNNSTRRSIRDRIREREGTHFNELVRNTEFAAGQVQYHLRQLLRDREVFQGQFYGRTHYYATDRPERERAALALFRRETTRALVVALLEDEPAHPADLAAELDVARSTVEHHLGHLVERDVVRKQTDVQGRVTVSLVDPQRTARLLQIVTPTVPDRFVDRFTRLVDDLLDTGVDE